jgi:hypothetical protein
LRNGSQIFKKWSEMVLTCWGFHKNVSRETFLVQEKESRIVADAVTVLGRPFSGLFSSSRHLADTSAESSARMRDDFSRQPVRLTGAGQRFGARCVDHGEISRVEARSA